MGTWTASFVRLLQLYQIMWIYLTILIQFKCMIVKDAYCWVIRHLKTQSCVKSPNCFKHGEKNKRCKTVGVETNQSKLTSISYIYVLLSHNYDFVLNHEKTSLTCILFYDGGMVLLSLVSLGAQHTLLPWYICTMQWKWFDQMNVLSLCTYNYGHN